MITFLATAIAVYIVIKAMLNVTKGLRDSGKAVRLGCKSPPWVRTIWWDPLGITSLRDVFRAASEGTIIDNIVEAFERVSEEQGRRVTFFGTKSIIGKSLMTRDPKIIQTMLATSFNDFEFSKARVEGYRSLLGTGIFSSNGAQWAHSRALLKPAFSKSQVSDVALEAKHCRNLMAALSVDEHGWTRQIDLQVLFYRLTMDSSTEFLFGESVDSQLHESADVLDSPGPGERKTKMKNFFARAFDEAQLGLAKKGVFRDYHWLCNPKGFKEACLNCHRFVDNYVQLALNQLAPNDDPGKYSDRYIFLSELAKETRDPIELRSQLISVLLAGRDTTASLLGFLFATLARRPDIFERLRSSIIGEFGTVHATRETSFRTLKACQYLQHCLHETLRLFPSVPINSRTASRDTVVPIGGGPDGQSPVFIPKNTPIMYSVAAMHRDRTLWGEDADDFRPERWIGRASNWSYLPFNGGPRICLGQQFALTSAGFATVAMLQRFDKIDNLDKCQKILQHQTLTASSKNGVKVRLHEAQALENTTASS